MPNGGLITTNCLLWGFDIGVYIAIEKDDVPDKACGFRYDLDGNVHLKDSLIVPFKKVEDYVQSNLSFKQLFKCIWKKLIKKIRRRSSGVHLFKYPIALILITISSFCYGQVARGFKKYIPMERLPLKEFADNWPVPKNPVEGELWKQNGHYWVQRNGEMEIVDKWFQEDTLVASKFIEDSAGNSYEIEYRYSPNAIPNNEPHKHYIALVNIIAYRGNKQKVIFSNIKAIYSPTECQADNRELWLKRLYSLQNKK